MKWTNEEIDILKKYYGSMSIKDLQHKYLKNKTIDMIKYKANKVGLRCDKSKIARMYNLRKYNYNKIFFQEPNITNSLWAGFIAADGCVMRKGNILSIDISAKDYMHLKNFARAIQYNGDVKYFNNMCYIVINGAIEMLDDLKRHFSIIERKSLILEPPKIHDEDYIRAFIRGYMDGDGSIFYSHNHWSVGFAGTKSMLEWIKYNIQKYVKNIGNPSVIQNRSIFQLVFQGWQIRSILSWLYYDSIIETRLSRKYNKYLEVLQFYPLNKKQYTSKYIGVCYLLKTDRWVSRYTYNGKRYCIGYFKTEKEAALAYNTKVRGLGLYDKCYEVE